MGRIRILSDNIANKIAAGEVVERPASVVKEMLENSLDAEANEIRVDVEAAGRRLIRIQDNGSGMLRDDAMLAFERHATSKLSDIKDLVAISTLGFRGEALPSIASVSRLLLETRSRDEETGAAVEIAGGKLLRCDEIARPAGTTITVRDLFYNVPARKKFLRSDPTELAHVGSLMTHYSLGHFGKRFELYHEGRELLNVTPVTSLRDRAYQVFGSELMQDLIELEEKTTEIKLPLPFVQPGKRVPDEEPPEPEFARFSLNGLVSGPHVQKLNRNSTYLFVNGRLIRDKVLLHSLTAAFHNLMPPGCFPFALLFLNCDPGEVDVNVHPTKTEVRFRHSSFVHDFVRDAVRSTLMAQRPASNMLLAATPSPEIHVAPYANHHTEPAYQEAAGLPFSEFSNAIEGVLPPMTEYVSPLPEAPRQQTAPMQQDDWPQDREQDLPEFRIAQNTGPLESRSVTTSSLTSATVARTSSRAVPDTHNNLSHLPTDWERADTLAALPDLRPIGQLHESFIIAAGRDGLWVIDQHVAHERILFEQVQRQRARGAMEVQALLMPMVLQLTPSQQFEYARIADELNAAGFETEPFGQRTIAVTSAPAGISAGELEKVIFEILDLTERELRAASMAEIRADIAATIACRAAIKINTRLDQAKMEWLLKTLAQCEYPMTCPHGRPIALRYTTKDILKSFHRI